MKTILLALLMISAASNCFADFRVTPFGATTMVTTYPTFLTAGGGVDKQELMEVEADAYQFLAGDPLTIALHERIEELRSEHPSLKDASDEEVVLKIVEILNP